MVGTECRQWAVWQLDGAEANVDQPNTEAGPRKEKRAARDGRPAEGSFGRFGFH